jgi:hypothetical protein
VFDALTDAALQTVTGADGTFQNDGTFRKSGGTGTTAVGGGGVVFNNRGTLRVQGGTLAFVGPGGLGFANAGTVDVQAGTLSVPANYTQNSGRTIVRGTLEAPGVVDLQGGSLSGTGTVTGDVVNFAQVLPGRSPGVLTVNGDFTQTATGGPVFEVNGTAAGTQYDQLKVSGTVTLGGALTVTVGYASAAGDTYVLIDNDGADPVAGTFAGLPEGAAFAVGGRPYRISYAGGTGNDVTLTRLALPAVQSVVVNDGSAQRSRVTSLTVTFNAVVALPANPADAFTLSRVGGNTVGLNVATSTATGATVATITFAAGADVQFGSLVDGDYTFTVLGAQVTGPGGVQLDGDDNGAPGGDNIAALHRYYGDSNGDRRVDLADFGPFAASIFLQDGQPGYLAYFDANGDGRVDLADFGEFAARIFTQLP